MQQTSDAQQLSFRNRYITGQKVPENAREIVKNIFAFFEEKYQEHGCEGQYVGAIDETRLWFDLRSSRTCDFRGVKSKTAGKEKLPYTVVLSAMADGSKLPALIIFKNLAKVPKRYISQRCEWLQKVL